MGVQFQLMKADASIKLDASQQFARLAEMFPAILGTVDISRSTERWEYHQAEVTVQVGEVAMFVYPPVPRDELHEYHIIAFQYQENVSHIVRGTLIVPRPPASALFSWFSRSRVWLASQNLLGDYPGGGTLSDVTHSYNLWVPPTVQLSVESISVAGAISVVGVQILRRVLTGPFETREVLLEGRPVVTTA